MSDHYNFRHSAHELPHIDGKDSMSVDIIFMRVGDYNDTDGRIYYGFRARTHDGKDWYWHEGRTGHAFNSSEDVLWAFVPPLKKYNPTEI